MLQRARVIARVAQAAGLAPARLEQAIAEQRRVPSWVFLGPPGVGKGTYASRVADALGLAHIAAGDLVRHEMKAQTELGRKVGVGALNLAVSQPRSCLHTILGASPAQCKPPNIHAGPWASDFNDVGVACCMSPGC